MSSFKCSCGEHILRNKTGITVCWFCKAEYSLSSTEKIVSINFERQKVLPVIKSTANPFPASADRRKLNRKVEI